jgi:hypothetical protein
MEVTGVHFVMKSFSDENWCKFLGKTMSTDPILEKKEKTIYARNLKSSLR